MFRVKDDFNSAWAYEVEATLRVFDAIPDAALDQAVAEGHRTLRRLAWHLVESLIEMPARWGLAIAGKELMNGPAIGAPPAHMADIRRAYTRANESLLAGLAGWTDATLLQEDDMYGERWARGKSLAVLIGHQTHHRGQMTVLLRQAGLVVPEVYGPAKEGWAAFGAQPPLV
jgi:uncharacterized damage-inducible protein DinB